MNQSEKAVHQRVQQWLSGPYDDDSKSEIRRLQEHQKSELADAFYRDLSFGTGGMRGVMGIGTNRMNVYTVRFASQGLANYLLEMPVNDRHRVFIGYDVRHNSRAFAEECARTLAGNGIEALITSDICPTPLASFGCRFYHCSAAIMITASHNPPQYNGYKVYWSDGAQIVPPHDEGIIAKVRLIQSPDQVRIAPIEHPLIRWIGDAIDEVYLKELDRQHLLVLPENPSLKVIYTNLHGTGLRLIPAALHRQGFTHVRFVEAQKSYDGKFPFAPTPNPEDEKALALGTKQLMEEKADLLLANDPDADRLGAVVRCENEAHRLNGNQIACICLAYLASQLKAKGPLPANGAYIKTIVTSEMSRKIAEDYGIECFDVLTGFKYIAELMRIWEQSPEGKQFLFGAEESHGYLIGAFVRDKDGIAAACLLSEAAEMMKQQNRTLIDYLYDLYRIYGVHCQSLTTLAFADSLQGMEQMQALMQKLRKKPPVSIGGRPIVCREDYLERTSIDCQTKEAVPIALPISDVLRFWLSDGTKLVIRPSGTEPKVKIYAEVCDPPASSIEESLSACGKRLKEIVDAFKETLDKSC